MTGTFAQTEKQMEILNAIFAAHEAGGSLSFDALRDQLSYSAFVSKQTIHCSLRILEGHGLISKNYEPGARKVMKLTPTPLAYSMLRPGSGR